jgi:hypothetical protein
MARDNNLEEMAPALKRIFLEELDNCEKEIIGKSQGLFTMLKKEVQADLRKEPATFMEQIRTKSAKQVILIHLLEAARTYAVINMSHEDPEDLDCVDLYKAVSEKVRIEKAMTESEIEADKVRLVSQIDELESGP